DVNGLTQYFGPYTDSKIFIPGKDMLGTTPKGDYTIKMIGKTKNGKTVIKDDEAHLVLWTPSPDDEMMRFSIIYGFDSFNAIKMYEQYLTKIIIPKIPNGATVIISGYADITGDSNYNEKLSRDRANDVKSILNAGLIKAGKTNVVFNVTGYGEKLDYAPFENKLPEERFYNRTVIIDVVQKK
ncbi:MAG: OmpA family protein, partial [Bacteroidales bacterium]|nr:OmpA family protein [Bacteroidales bacterium]